VFVGKDSDLTENQSTFLLIKKPFSYGTKEQVKQKLLKIVIIVMTKIDLSESGTLLNFFAGKTLIVFTYCLE
jgi:uncharacterized protein YpbB